MQVTSSTFTIAEYCQQMREKSIIVNHDYQRSDKVWPPAARSYPIETNLLGFPIPKLSLYQTTDLKTKKTKKEIVDGQQRSQVISDFLEGTFRLTNKGQFAGKLQSQREPGERICRSTFTATIPVKSCSTGHSLKLCSKPGKWARASLPWFMAMAAIEESVQGL
jgi:hypothetical protein